jgi:hypothetical protein
MKSVNTNLFVVLYYGIFTIRANRAYQKPSFFLLFTENNINGICRMDSMNSMKTKEKRF